MVVKEAYLKARPQSRNSALLNNLANRFKSDIVIENYMGDKCNAKSSFHILFSEITHTAWLVDSGSANRIKIYAEGEDEKEAMEEFINLIKTMD